ncbi:hypothetical protein [Bacillus haynesii]|uniref:hypothetical protein n=1 Tax=Bacillus haynesii TaxID=1925021 RepID=UPI00227F944B|nr:hypothetical protein [Bacillus haynesii]MCY7911904.1 hypothetical protein [Bacillus haynesii]MCY7924823.1 hypothetical protein [Bacillus haynesii]MCY8773161.1 hypothetical protein [Bacillus haynesii]MEC0721343.1 hypothetical protein [Bacillus haynesii]MEC0786239.1 hypothetical protein [Bacillus haynesii]
MGFDLDCLLPFKTFFQKGKWGTFKILLLYIDVGSVERALDDEYSGMIILGWSVYTAGTAKITVKTKQKTSAWFKN